MTSLLSAAVFVTAVQALAFDGKPPQPTDGLIPSPAVQLPKITLPPSIHELAKRQNGQTVLVGPDNTCGYFDGRAGAVYSCNGKDVTCALVTTSSYGAVACCDGDDCGLRVACIDYREFMLSSACDNGCVQDTFTVKCTKSSAPFCGTVTFFDGIVDYYCDTLSASTPQQLYTTYDGETDGRSFTPVVITLDETTSHAQSATASVDTDGDNTSASSSTNSPVPTSADNNGGNGGSKSSTPIGPIVGGVVGGVGGIALIGLGIFFLIRHNNKKNATAAQPAAQMVQGPGVPPGAPGVAAAGYGQQPPYDAHYSQQYPNQPGSPPGYPPQTYYPDASKPGGFATVGPVPDRNNSTSPVSTQYADNRPPSMQPPTSPTSTINSNWQQGVAGYPVQQHSPQPNVPPTVHEAGGNAVGERDYNSNHHGQLHELS
ncbi:hypothetical protein F5Y05DRAFT_326947 [Hypoxylon sp. FL0543]|nr:hypothetical protein F5Y05DRAFT_326947 [Hypoxylon sp. FL0543]